MGFKRFLLFQTMPKSRSFRDSSQRYRPIKYKKNKTTNLDKLTSSMSAHTLKCSSSDDEQQAILDKKSTVVTISPVKRKNSGSFMQSVTSMFKNIRWLSVHSPMPVTVQTAKTNQQPRLVTFRKLSNGRNLFCALKRQNTSQRLLPPESSNLPELIWIFVCW